MKIIDIIEFDKIYDLHCKWLKEYKRFLRSYNKGKSKEEKHFLRDDCTFIFDKKAGKQLWLTDSIIENIKFTEFDFSKAVFRRCIFRNVKFKKCNMIRTSFIDVAFDDVYFYDCTEIKCEKNIADIPISRLQEPEPYFYKGEGL